MVLGPLELIELDTREEPFPYTCTNCVHPLTGEMARGDFTSHWMYEETFHTTDGRNSEGEYWSKGQKDKSRDYYPVRCARCNRHYCKYKNTKKKVYELTEYSFQRRGQYAKMITVGLRSKWNDPRDKFTQIQELKSKWKKLRLWLVENFLVTGGIYVMEVTQKVSFDGTQPIFDRKEKKWVSQKIGEPDLSGSVKFHCHIHAVVDMPTYRGAALASFSEIGNKFGLGRISVTYHKTGQPHWEIKHAQTKYLAKYVSKDFDCGRQAAFGKFRGFKMPQPPHGEESYSCQTTF